MDLKAGLFGQTRERDLPEANAATVASAAITGDEQLPPGSKHLTSDAIPPSPNALPCELSRVGAGAEIHERRIVVDDVHAVRRDFPQISQLEVVIKNVTGRTFRAVLGPVVLEIPNVFLLLAVNRDDGVAILQKGFGLGVDELELLIPIRVRLAYLEHLLIDLLAVAEFFEQLADNGVADDKTLGGKQFGKIFRRLKVVQTMTR